MMHKAKHTGWLCVSVLVLGSMAIACGDDDAGGGGGGIEFVSAGVEREPADGTASGEASRAVTALGVDLFGLLRAADGNVAVSPYSLAVALAMTRAGAAGVTATEMDTVLHADGVENLHGAFGSLDALLAERSGSFPVLGGDPVDLELSFGNAVWPQRGFPFEEPFLETLARSYGSGVQAVDYADDTEAARAAINGWVSDRTRSRIPELIPSGVLTTLTRVVLTNAVYLNAPWLWPFDADATTDAVFTRLDGTTVDAPLMHLSETLAYTTGDGWQAVELPYVNEQLTMVVLVPDPTRYTTVEAALSGALIDQVEASLDDRLVELRLPRWKFRSQLDLKDPLRDLGMVSAFSDTADFSAMSPEHLMITDVLQEVYVAVDEMGTEAAAATAVVVGETSAPSAEPVSLTVDRPFLFWIIDAPSKAVLFLGRVSDPTA